MAQTRFSLMSLTRVRWRLSLTLLCLFASTFQSSLAQTHVHNAGGNEAYVAGMLVAADRAGSLSAAGAHPDSVDSSSNGQQPDHASTTRENTACPLCQVLMLGGGLPAAPYQMPVRSLCAAVHVSLEQVPACFISAVSYDWHSRGPPRI